MRGVKSMIGHKKREKTMAEELNPVLSEIEAGIESGEIDIDFPTAYGIVKRCLDGAAKELQYPHTFNGGDTMKLLHRLLRVVRSFFSTNSQRACKHSVCSPLFPLFWLLPGVEP